MNPSSVEENMEYSDGEKDSDSKSTTAKAASSVSGVDEYEFKDEEEEEDLSKALNDRHVLRRDVRPKEKDENHHAAAKQSSNKSERSVSPCKPRKSKAPKISYGSSDSSGDETETPSERKCSPSGPVCNDVHKTDGRTKRDSLNLASAEKGKASKKKIKSQSKNKENQEVREDGKENSKALLFSSVTVSDNSDKNVREEDSFKMSFSPKDDSSVHLFHLSSVKSPKLNNNQSDKQTTPLKQENTKTFVAVGDGPCPAESVKYNHYTDSDYTEGSSSKGCKHKDKSKHHFKEHGLDTDDGSSSPFNSLDGSDGIFRKADKDGKVVKKHKLKHREKDKYRKEYESERNRHRQKEIRKDGHRNMEFDREFWKENFFKSDENEELVGKGDTPGSCSPQKSLDSSPVKEDKSTFKDKHSSNNGSKEKKQKDDRFIKKERRDSSYREEKGKDPKGDSDDWTEGPLRKPEDFLLTVKEELEEKPLPGDPIGQNQVEISDKSSREKSDKRPPTRDREPDRFDRKQADKEKRIKSEHSAEKSDLHNPAERWKEKDRLSGTSHSSGDRGHKENEKTKVAPVSKKHEESKKSRDKLDRRSEKDRTEREPHTSSVEHKERTERTDRTSEKKAKAPEKMNDHGRTERFKEKDSDKRKKEKSKEASLSSSSSNLKLLLEDKKGYASESNKPLTPKSKDEAMKSPEKDRHKSDRDRDYDRHRERDRERHKDKDKDKERPQQSKDNKLCKARPVDSDSKPKSLPAQKDPRPKEKRLVNDDLMQTSFERMLSLKDQEIEQWHKKHLEKIKQKERERLKQRPVTDPGKQRNKERTRTSAGEPCANKELLRSKSSENPDGYSREKTLKDATGGRTLSLDARNSSFLGKVTQVENSSSRSPRPDSEKSSVISRSVSMISVASSEDSCQTTVLTPRTTEYDSDLNLEASDSQPPLLQSSLAPPSSRSPSVSDKDMNSLPDLTRMAPANRYPSSYLRAILDDDTKASTCEPDRPVEESQKANDVSQLSDESGKILPTDGSPEATQDDRSSPDSLAAQVPQVPVAEHSSSVEEEINTRAPQEPHAKELVPADCDLPTTAEVSGLNLDAPSELGLQGQSDGFDKTLTERTASNLDSCVNSEPQCCTSLQWDAVSRTDALSEAELKERTETDPEIRTADDTCMENLPDRSNVDPMVIQEGLSEESSRAPVCANVAAQDSISLKESADLREFDDDDVDDDVGACDDLSKKKEPPMPVATSRCPSPEGTSDEPADVPMEDGQAETKTDNAVTPDDETPTLPESNAETADHLADEEKPNKPSESPSDRDPIQAGVQLDPQTEPLSGTTSGSSSPLSVVDRDCDTSGVGFKVKPLDVDVDLLVTHPRKRKMPKLSPSTQTHLSAQQMKEKTQQSLAAIVDALKLEEIEPYQTERANPYFEFLHIRKKIEEKRKVLCNVIPQAPQYYDEYVTFNGSYLLDGNPLSKLCIPTVSPFLLGSITLRYS